MVYQLAHGYLDSSQIRNRINPIINRKNRDGEKDYYENTHIVLKWMDDITVDKKGRLVYYHQEYTHTDKPMPDPIDPSTRSNYQDDEADSETPAEPELSEEEQAELDIKEESQQETEEAAEDAGILPEGESNAV